MKSCIIQKAIGYQEINDYFKNKISLSEMCEKKLFLVLKNTLKDNSHGLITDITLILK